ncbi:DNA circularization N-terminal domain-containing protein [bacterium]|jgi:hypothetical protein|nr:DNA circularization N-terminal domain-containing protein [bacterium]
MGRFFDFSRLFQTSFDGTPVLTPQKAVYKSPKGQKITFDFEDVESSISKKSAVFESASGSGTYVQSNGHTSGRFPMVAIFHGPGYEKRASAFLGALLEDGVGVLTHPVYGAVNVVPVGEIARTDAFKSAANQTMFAVSFYETTGLQVGGAKSLNQSFDALLDASAADFSDKASLDDPVSAETFKQRLENTVKTIQSTMRKASQGVSAVTDGMDDIGDSINRGIDLLVGSPLGMARQVQMLIGAPRRMNDSAQAKLDGYRNMARDIFNRTLSEPSEYSEDTINQFHLDRLISQTVVANHTMLSVEAVGQYLTRDDYLTAADVAATLLEEYQAWHDLQYAEFAESEVWAATTDTGDGLADLRALVAGICGQLVGLSFQGKTRMVAELEGSRTPLDLCFELYGTTAPDTFDHFCSVNGLHGDEFFLIGKGREVVWYV